MDASTTRSNDTTKLFVIEYGPCVHWASGPIVFDARHACSHRSFQWIHSLFPPTKHNEPENNWPRCVCVHSSRTGTCSVDDVALALLDHRIVSSLCAPQVLKWPHHHEQWTKNVLVFSNSERTCTLIRLLVVFVATMGCVWARACGA